MIWIARTLWFCKMYQSLILYLIFICNQVVLFINIILHIIDYILFLEYCACIWEANGLSKLVVHIGCCLEWEIYLLDKIRSWNSIFSCLKKKIALGICFWFNILSIFFWPCSNLKCSNSNKELMDICNIDWLAGLDKPLLELIMKISCSSN